MTENYKESGLNNQIILIGRIPLILISLLLLIFLFLITLTWPINADHGNYFSLGDVILDGGMVYSDAWTMKGIFIPYFYALLSLLFGDVSWGLRLVDIVIASYGAVAGWYIINKLTDKYTACIVTICYQVNYFNDYYLSAQPEIWIAVVITIMMAILFSDSGRFLKRNAIISGLLLTLIGSIKLPYLILCILPVSYALIYCDRKFKNAVKFIIITGLVSLFSTSLIMLWLFYNDALESMIEIQFGYAFQTHLKIIFVNEMMVIAGSSINDFFFDDNRIIYTVLFLPSIILLWIKMRKECILLLIWFALALFMPLAQQKEYGTYLLLMVAPLVISSSFIIGKLKNTSYYLCCILLIIFSFSHSLKQHIGPVTDYIMENGLSGEKFPYSKYPDDYNELIAVSDYLDKEENKNKKLLLLGSDGILATYHFADMKPLTRFIPSFPIDFAEGERKDLYAKEILQEFYKSPPKYIIYNMPFYPMYSYFGKNNFLTEEIREIVHNNYYVEETIESYVVLRYMEYNICVTDPDYLYILFYYEAKQKKAGKSLDLNN